MNVATTLTLDEEALIILREEAKVRGQTVSALVRWLARALRQGGVKLP